MSDDGRGAGARRVLHVVVGHSQPTYFVNAVRSVRSVAPLDDVLVIDNASPDEALRRDLTRLGQEDPRVTVVLRDSNDLSRNGKVGGLYDAYREAFAYALASGVEYLHLLQGDMQLLWWAEEIVERATEIYDAHPRCVNVFTCLLTRNREETDELVPSDAGPPTLRHYGLTDTGLYHLGRWQEFDMAWGDDELDHARRYLAAGLEVVCHPWPTDAPIPWPAVIRRGRMIGREVVARGPLLLVPPSPDQIADAKRRGWSWLEDLCQPWGWACLVPMWTTGLDSADYLAALRRVASRHGILAALPRWRSGGRDRFGPPPLGREHRPSALHLFVAVPLRELFRRLSDRARRVPEPRP